MLPFLHPTCQGHPSGSRSWAHWFACLGHRKCHWTFTVLSTGGVWSAVPLAKHSPDVLLRNFDITPMVFILLFPETIPMHEYLFVWAKWLWFLFIENGKPNTYEKQWFLHNLFHNLSIQTGKPMIVQCSYILTSLFRPLTCKWSKSKGAI